MYHDKESSHNPQNWPEPMAQALTGLLYEFPLVSEDPSLEASLRVPIVGCHSALTPDYLFTF